MNLHRFSLTLIIASTIFSMEDNRHAVPKMADSPLKEKPVVTSLQLTKKEETNELELCITAYHFTLHNGPVFLSIKIPLHDQLTFKDIKELALKKIIDQTCNAENCVAQQMPFSICPVALFKSYAKMYATKFRFFNNKNVEPIEEDKQICGLLKNGFDIKKDSLIFKIN